MRRRLAALFAVASGALCCAPAVALAAPDCPEHHEARPLLEGQGVLESVIVDPRGPLYFTNGSSLLRLDRPGAEPAVVASFEAPGGLAFDPAGNIIVGSGNTIANGSVGDVTGPARLLEVDVVSGAVTEHATGLSMGNGLVRGPDGSYYASNDAGSNIDRIVDGETERGWATVQSGNGLAIDSGGRWLYAAQTFRPAAIQQIDLTDPSRVTPFVVAGPDDTSAGLDGMDRDAADRLFVAANGSGQVWRVAGSPPSICVVVRGLPGFPDGPSAVAVGKPGTPFPPENLYVVAFNGTLLEIPGAAIPAPVPAPAAPAPLRVSVRPSVVVVRKRTRFVITVERFAEGGWQRARGARVRFARRTLTTGSAGRVRVRVKFRRLGTRRVRASLDGARRPVATVVVRQP